MMIWDVIMCTENGTFNQLSFFLLSGQLPPPEFFQSFRSIIPYFNPVQIVAGLSVAFRGWKSPSFIQHPFFQLCLQLCHVWPKCWRFFCCFFFFYKSCQELKKHPLVQSKRPTRSDCMLGICQVTDWWRGSLLCVRRLHACCALNVKTFKLHLLISDVMKEMSGHKPCLCTVSTTNVLLTTSYISLLLSLDLSPFL